MPRGDRTGPAGQGPMTGRGAGYCTGYSVPGFMNPGPGRGGAGFGLGRGFFGRGGGRGWRNMNYAAGPYGWQGDWMPGPPPVDPYAQAAPQMSAEQQVDALKNQVKYMEDSIKAARERISEMEKDQE